MPFFPWALKNSKPSLIVKILSLTFLAILIADSKSDVSKARIGRNPKNSEPVQIPQKKAIKWKMSKILYRRLNKNFTENKKSDIH